MKKLAKSVVLFAVAAAMIGPSLTYAHHVKYHDCPRVRQAMALHRAAKAEKKMRAKHPACGGGCCNNCDCE